MAITAKKSEQFERELIPAGNYLARCYKMIEIGTVPNEYLGVAKMTHKVRIGWELPTELKVFNPEKGEQPCIIDKDYTLSLADGANLTRDLNSWRGKPFTAKEAEDFDITALIGVPCLLNITHKPSKKDPLKIYEQISSISPLPKGMTCDAQINPDFVFELESFDENKFNSLPEFIRSQIIESNEYKKIHGLEEKIIPLKSAVQEYQNKVNEIQVLEAVEVDPLEF